MNPEESPMQQQDSVLEEAEQLIWSLLDEQVEETNVKRLETLLRENEQVRRRYVECVQLHSDLVKYFNPDGKPPYPAQGNSPVLGSLGNLGQESDTLPLPEEK